MLAFPGTLLLWRRSGGDHGKRLALLVYGLSLAFCYSASTLYHGVRLPEARVAAFARLDGVGIFALIAGSYTPLAWCLLRGHWRRWTLAAVWGVAATATILIAAGRHLDRGGLVEIAHIVETMNRRTSRQELIRILRGHTPEVQDTGS